MSDNYNITYFTFQILGTPSVTFVRVTFVRRRVGETFNSDCVVPMVQHAEDNIMAWGCMNVSGVGEMFFCEKFRISINYYKVTKNGQYY